MTTTSTSTTIIFRVPGRGRNFLLHQEKRCHDPNWIHGSLHPHLLLVLVGPSANSAIYRWSSPRIAARSRIYHYPLARTSDLFFSVEAFIKAGILSCLIFFIFTHHQGGSHTWMEFYFYCIIRTWDTGYSTGSCISPPNTGMNQLVHTWEQEH